MKEYTIRHKEYISIILGYIVIVTLLSLSLDYIFCPVYGDVLLYTDEARSLADSGTLKFANMYGVSGAYLYPLIISLVYKFFYNAYTIVFWVRFVGIVLMTSAIFPAYILLGKMKIYGKKRVLLAYASVLIPDMLQTWLPVTEVLAYPLFMWTVVLFFVDMQRRKSVILPIVMAIICYLNYMTRGQSLVIALAYICSLMSFSLLEFINKKAGYLDYLKKILLFIVPFVLLYLGIPKLLTYLGVIAEAQDAGAMHLAETMKKLMDNLPYYLFQWSIGCLWYIFYIVLAFGFFTIVIPAFYREYVDDECNKLVIFLNTTFLLTILIVVLIIYSMEEPLEYETHRVHQRYFFYFYAPYLFLLYKIEFEKFDWKRIYILCASVFCTFIAIGRFVYNLRENFFLGPEAIALSFFKVSKEFIAQYPNTEQWITMGALIFIFLIMFIVRQKGWNHFMMRWFPALLITASLINVAIFTQRDLYITRVGMGDYVSRYAPAADFLKQYDTGEVVTVVRVLCDDNEVQTFQVINQKCLDVISLGELEEAKSLGNGRINIKQFDRTGYYYIDSSKHRILEDAEYIAIMHSYIDGIYDISNEVVYDDPNVIVYKLDEGVLNII